MFAEVALIRMDALFSSSPLDLNNFLQVLSGSAWGSTACTKTIDNLFQCALHFQKDIAPELTNMYPGIDFKKSVDLLLENIIKNDHINEHITLYAVNKYINLSSNKNLSVLLESIISETELRESLVSLNQEYPNVDLDFYKINRLLQDLDSPNCDNKMINAIKFETSVFLNALEHCLDLTGPVLINKLINCLESEIDLKLWFMLFKNENADAVVKLCRKYNSFLDAVLMFFDKFAEEIESTYDEDLNVKYSHVNLDFEDFVKILRVFLKEKSICKIIQEYLDGKTLLDKNYCFWIDIKSCIEH